MNHITSEKHEKSNVTRVRTDQPGRYSSGGQAIPKVSLDGEKVRPRGGDHWWLWLAGPTCRHDFQLCSPEAAVSNSEVKKPPKLIYPLEN